MKIVVLDGYVLNPGDLSWDGFKQLGEFLYFDRTNSDETISRICDAEIVITNKTQITKEIMDQCPNIKYIGILSTGYNVVDIAYATEKGITVTNIPNYVTDGVSQYVFALLLEICHHVGHHSQSVFDGKWSRGEWCYWDYPLIELSGKTIGIIGYGKIGQSTAKIAVAFGMKVLAYSPHKNTKLESNNISYAELDELLTKSDIISLHCPLSDTTKGIINKDNISKMKDGVIIINTSRGPLVVEHDMYDALQSGKVSYFACDVVSSEPILNDNILLNAKNCIITPHIAWAPEAARKRLMDTAVQNLKSFCDGNIINSVN